MTLVEVLIATAIGGMVLAAAGSLMVYNTRSLAALTNYADLDRDSRLALDKLSRDIRQATGLLSYTTNQFQLGTVAGGPITYTYDSPGRTLVRVQGANRETLLDECSYLVVTVYGRSNVSNAWDQFPVTNAAEAKLIKLNWNCTRTILGQTLNSESVQTAKIVIRQ